MLEGQAKQQMYERLYFCRKEIPISQTGKVKISGMWQGTGILMFGDFHNSLILQGVRGDYRRGLDWWVDSLTTCTLTTPDYTLQTTESHRLVSSVYCSFHEPFPGNGT
jgi:hypothetical protein